MRKIITTTFVSLDGVMQAPGGPDEDPDGGFEHGGWMFGYWDDIGGNTMDSFMRLPFELLLGRRTYDIFASYWPTATTDQSVAEPFNRTRKYVVSHTQRQLSWNNSTLRVGNHVFSGAVEGFCDVLVRGRRRPVGGEDVVGAPTQQEFERQSHEAVHRVVCLVPIAEHPAAVGKAAVAVFVQPARRLHHAIEGDECGCDDLSHDSLLP
jgi:dihydrofolate reductase